MIDDWIALPSLALCVSTGVIISKIEYKIKSSKTP